MLRLMLSMYLVLTAGAALACEPIPNYHAPTNVELLSQADLVVLATVQSGPTTYEEGWNGHGFDPLIILRPVKVLKGVSPKSLRVKGVLTDKHGDPNRPIVTSLNLSHPSTLEGACIRQRYAKGVMVLALFRRTPTGYVQLDHAFARVVEDVQGPRGLWPRAAELYLRLLRIRDPGSRRAAFRSHQRKLASNGGKDAAISADIARYLKATRQ